MIGSVPAHVDCHCSSKELKITNRCGHYQSYLKAINHLWITEFKYLKHFIAFIAWELHSYHNSAHISWEIIFTIERIRSKMYLKASGHPKMTEDSYLAWFFFLNPILMYKWLVNKTFPLFCYITFLAWRLKIPLTGAENTPERKTKSHVILWSLLCSLK